MPKPSKTFDLNAVEREDNPGPFVFQWGDPERQFSMIDPQETDYRELMPILANLASGNIKLAVDLLIGDKDEAKAFWKDHVPAYKLNALADAWLDHYGINPGEADASPPFLNRSARRSKQTSHSGR